MPEGPQAGAAHTDRQHRGLTWKMKYLVVTRWSSTPWSMTPSCLVIALRIKGKISRKIRRTKPARQLGPWRLT